MISNGTLVIASSTASTLTGLSGTASGTLQVGGSGNILTISGSTANFNGAINVTAGNTLKAGAANTLGTTNATTTIASGAVMMSAALPTRVRRSSCPAVASAAPGRSLILAAIP